MTRRKKDPPRSASVLTFIVMGAVFVFLTDWLLGPRAPERLPPPLAPAAIAPQAGQAARVFYDHPPPAPDLPAWKKYALPAQAPPGLPKIAIIIDDVGIDRKRAIESIALPGAITLAFLPYAHRVESLAALAREKGHELLVHMPMEPMDADIDPGQGVLTAAMTPETFAAALDKNLSAIEAYVGINNHMGSRMTADAPAMNRLMEAIKPLGLAFVDSRTSAQSIAARAARAHALPWAERDVFLDHVPGRGNVWRSLARLEKTAREKGIAVAIGHPKDDTLAVLRAWIPTLEEKGFSLVPITAVLTVPHSERIESVGFSSSSSD